MTIDEAIKVQTEMLDIVFNAKSPERSRALKLGIEALKWMRDERVIHGYNRIPHIVGETKE